MALPLTFPFRVRAEIIDDMSLPGLAVIYGDGHKQRRRNGLVVPKTVWNIECVLNNKADEITLENFIRFVGHHTYFLWQSPRDVAPRLYCLTGRVGGNYRLGGGNKKDFFVRTMQFEDANDSLQPIPIPIPTSILILTSTLPDSFGFIDSCTPTPTPIPTPTPTQRVVSVSIAPGTPATVRNECGYFYLRIKVDRAIGKDLVVKFLTGISGDLYIIPAGETEKEVSYYPSYDFFRSDAPLTLEFKAAIPNDNEKAYYGYGEASSDYKIGESAVCTVARRICVFRFHTRYSLLRTPGGDTFWGPWATTSTISGFESAADRIADDANWLATVANIPPDFIFNFVRLTNNSEASGEQLLYGQFDFERMYRYTGSPLSFFSSTYSINDLVKLNFYSAQKQIPDPSDSRYFPQIQIARSVQIIC